MPTLQQLIQALITYSVGTFIGGLAGAGAYLVVFKPDTEPCVTSVLRDCPPPPSLNVPELAGLVALGMVLGFVVERLFFRH